MNKSAVLLIAVLALFPGASIMAEEIPPAATTQVEFVRDIKPIFDNSCVTCHKQGKAKGKLRLDVREEALKGGSEGPAMIAGKSAESLLIQLVAGAHPDFDRMPPKGDPLTPEQIGLLRAWIDQGMEWPDGVTCSEPKEEKAAPASGEAPKAETTPNAEQAAPATAAPAASPEVK